jgi:phospho-2-dehydro-3-deoxyheptonate aldolase
MSPPPSTFGSVILLNGTSSAGKSTLANAVQDVMDAPYLCLGIDLFFDALPQRDVARLGVARAVADQVASGEPGIIGVMLESFLIDGRQELTDRTDLTVGQSVTDACLGWEMTVPVLREFAASVRARRALLANSDRQLPSEGQSSRSADSAGMSQ